MNIKQLKTELEKNINLYIEKFCKKHDLYFEYWIADRVGGICQISEYYFNFEDIRIDLELKQPKDFIIDWYDANLENEEYINYTSYIKGLLHNML